MPCERARAGGTWGYVVSQSVVTSGRCNFLYEPEGPKDTTYRSGDVAT